jgi:2-keto-4-pentenoate hydratase/2-oxohepta-3-ene-1,7-dioic acid hydratase in catechol pathway
LVKTRDEAFHTGQWRGITRRRIPERYDSSHAKILKSGDVVDVEISKVGVLRNTIVSPESCGRELLGYPL